MIVNPTTFKSGGEKNEYQVEIVNGTPTADFEVILGDATYTAAQTIIVPSGTWCKINCYGSSVNGRVLFNENTPSTISPSSANSYVVAYDFAVFRDCKIRIQKPVTANKRYGVVITTS